MLLLIMFRLLGLMSRQLLPVTQILKRNDNSDAAGTVEAGSNSQLDAHGNLRVRSDADAEAQAIDQNYNDESALHAEHSLEVNVF
jgi:hypothetical protein